MKNRPGSTDPVRACEQTPRFFELAIQRLSEAVFIIDADAATICHCNPAAAELFGYAAQEMVGRTMGFLYPDPEAAAFRTRFHSAAGQTEALVLRGWRMKRKDGAIFVAAQTLTPMDDDSGRRVGWLSLVWDRTEHKSNVAAMREREALVGALLENLPLDFWARDMEMRCILQSQLSKQKWGDLRGKAFEEQGLDPQTLAVWRENNRRVLAGETIRGDVEMVDAQGQVYHCYNILAPITDGGRITGILGVNVDITDRKRMEDALRASEERYRLLYENAPVGLFKTLIEDGRALEVNDYAVRMFGYDSREEFIQEFVAGDHYVEADGRENFLKELREKGEIQSQEAQFLNKDGSRQWASYSAKAYPEKGWIEVAGVAIDDRKRMEEALRTSEERHRLLYDSALVGLVTTSIQDGRVVQANDEAARLFGYGSKEEFAREFDPAEHYAKPGGREALIEELRTKGDIRKREACMRRKDGSYIWVEYSVRVSREKGWIEAVLMDVDNRKHMEAELRKFKTIFDNANYGTAMAEMDGTLIYVNEYFAQVHGYRPEELVGKNLSIFHTDEQMKDVTAINEKLKETGSYSAQELWHKRRDGSVFPMLMNGIVIRDDSGRPLFIAATAIDITIREAARKQARELSQRIITLQEDLLSDISRDLHDEIGQLLTAIDFEVETVRRAVKSGKGLPPDGLDRIKEVTHSATLAVRGLCTSLRSPIIKDLGLVGVMKANINHFRERTGIDVRFHCSLKKSGVSPEAGLGLFRIMQEALTNVARHAEARQVSVSLRRDTGRTVLEISDDGRGFDVDSPPSHLSSGVHGMRERARIFGGEFAIESKPGGGTRIRVSPPPPSGEEAPL